MDYLLTPHAHKFGKFAIHTMTPDNLAWLTGLATTLTIVLGAWFTIIKFIKPLTIRIKALFETTEHFIRDWQGTPAEPGRDAVPGVMERLNNIDGELKRNGGKSVKDTVNRIEKRLVDGDKKFDDLYTRVIHLEQGVNDLSSQKTNSRHDSKKI